MTCGSNVATFPVASCTPHTAAAGNNWTETTCPAPVVTTNVPVATCVAASPNAANNWTESTCPAPILTSNVPVASCTPQAASAGNSWTTTSCPVANTTVPTAVASCTPVTADAGNNWTATLCTPDNTTNVPVESCTAAVASGSNNWKGTTCPAANVTTDVPVASCTAAAASAANNWTTTTCPAAKATTNVPVDACSPQAAVAGNGWTTVTCNTNDSVPAAVSSCTPQAATAANGWSAVVCSTHNSVDVAVDACEQADPSSANGWTRTTCNTVTVLDEPVPSCIGAAASASNQWTATTCKPVESEDTLVAACTAAAAGPGNAYTTTACTPVNGRKMREQTTTTVTRTLYSGGAVAGSLPGDEVTSGWADVVPAVCYANPVDEPPLPGPTQVAGYPKTTGTTHATGSSDSLADVAQYYYVTDLRPEMVDDVRFAGSGPEDDRVSWQHMTTFGIALGVSGTLNFRSDYKSATSGDFADIRSPLVSKPWPVWPDPALDYTGNKELWNNPKSIDDFWHAAVNGRGQFFSARNPDEVITGVGNALYRIQEQSGGAPATTSTMEPVVGDNYVFTASHTTSAWSGDVQKRQIDLSTGEVESAVDWSAKQLLDARTAAACDDRKIYLLQPGAGDNRLSFSWNTRACDNSGQPTGSAESGLAALGSAKLEEYFGAGRIALLSQYPNMTYTSPSDQRTAAGGANLVNFLRGQRGLEGFVTGDMGKLYRQRSNVLGDIVNGQPVYVKAPFARYSDAGYQTFKNANQSRTPMLYVPANDGMLHAFYAGTDGADSDKGQEAWAFIPSTVLPNLYRLADANYRTMHQYSVDGTPTLADAYDQVSGSWKTILVGGLNLGGRGYYALDVTDPASPKGLWELKDCSNATLRPADMSDCDLGYSFGRPIVTKRADGRWVVIVTSGYNNVSPGDGEGHVYVLDAFTGQILSKISTGEGDTSTPSGLTHVSNFVDNTAVDNTTLRLYGGDLLGNIWRFDIANGTATLIGTAKDGSGAGQPITTRPELAEIEGKPMVFVATGRLLGAGDLSDSRVQSIYGVMDPLTVPGGTAAVYGDLRSSLKPRTMTQTGTAPSAMRTIACPATATEAQCAVSSGWVVDLPDPGERVNVDMRLQLGTLVVASNVPNADACNAGGYSWLNYVDFSTGLSVPSSPGLSVSQYLANSLTVGLGIVRLPGVGGQTGNTKAIASTADGKNPVRGIPVSIPAPAGKRISWREIAAQ